MPSVMPPISSSQFAPEPKPLITMRTTHVPPDRASTSHSVASVTVSPAVVHSSDCANRRGGSQPVTRPEPFMPSPMS